MEGYLHLYSYLNPGYAIDIYCGLKKPAATLVSLEFFKPRYDAHFIIRVKR
jgi:hypothetical protein